MIFTRPPQPDIIRGSGTPGSGAAWPIASSPIHIVDGPARPRRAPPLVSPGCRVGAHRIGVTPQHRLDGGLLSAAEVRGLVPAVEDSWLLRAACREAEAWLAALGAFHRVRVVVGLSPRGRSDGGLASVLKQALAETDLPSGLLEVALAEEDLASDGPEMPLLVSALRDLGAGVALNRASGARVCLRILHRLPLTAIRLQPALTQGVEHSSAKRFLVMQAVRAAHAVGAVAVALGVQTAMQRDILADLTCDEAEGPFFSPELASETFRGALE